MAATLTVFHSPRGARAVDARASMFVRAQVSSRKTSRSAISPGCSALRHSGSRRRDVQERLLLGGVPAVFFCDSTRCLPEESRQQPSSASPGRSPRDTLAASKTQSSRHGDARCRATISHRPEPECDRPWASQFRFLPATVFVGFDRGPAASNAASASQAKLCSHQIASPPHCERSPIRAISFEQLVWPRRSPEQGRVIHGWRSFNPAHSLNHFLPRPLAESQLFDSVYAGPAL